MTPLVRGQSVMGRYGEKSGSTSGSVRGPLITSLPSR